MAQSKAPLYDTLQSLCEGPRASFHVPGHKFGQAARHFEATSQAMLLEQTMAIDYTEITGLDDLHQPQGIIMEAQQLAAHCFGADHTFFLINGSTAGNLALILTVCDEGDLIIVQRDVHKSVLHGLMLARAKAVFIAPHIDPDSGLSIGITEQQIEAALRQYPQAKAVLLTNPSYYGLGIPLKPIADLVHEFDIPLLVDEAHGAHYGFHASLPASALASGADGVVQSTHKMLTALTMGAMLHIQGPRIDSHVVQQRLAMIQSTSPSYPIMASLDWSRRQIALHGEDMVTAGLAVVNTFLARLATMNEFTVAKIGAHNHVTKDPFKVALRDATGTLSGFALQRALEQHGCVAELADPHYVLLVFSIASQNEEADRLVTALQNISQQFALKKKEKSEITSNITTLPQFIQSATPISFQPVNYARAQVESVAIEKAAQRRSAEMVVPYPPGIPLLFPGEVITEEMISFLKHLAKLGASFQGASDIKLLTLQVICDTSY